MDQPAIRVLRPLYKAHYTPLTLSVRPCKRVWAVAASNHDSCRRKSTSAHSVVHREPSRASSRSQRSPTPLEKASQNAPKHAMGFQGGETVRAEEMPSLSRRMQDAAAKVLQHPSLPSEEDVMEALRATGATATAILALSDHPTKSAATDATPTSKLLSLDSRSTTPVKTVDVSKLKMRNQVSELAYRILLHPPVFISPRILALYVRIQTLLQTASTFPEIFSLYASKPAPKANTHPLSYRAPNPNNLSQAIPTDLASEALGCALASPNRDLDLCLDIIETSFRTHAYRNAKYFRKALPSSMLAGAAPFAAWTMASQLSYLQTSMDPATMTNVAFAGIATYIAAVGTLGVVALTTSNDQMDRVTWVSGMPLRERWVREEERAAVDRVAQAWGFKDTWKRGEEEGEEWEHLKEWIGLRGMVLDKVGLMEGME